MARYVAVVDSTWEAVEAYEYLADFSTIAEWDPGVRTAVLEGGRPASLGARYRLRLNLPGPGNELVYAVLAAQPPQDDDPGEVVLEASTLAYTSYDVITVTPTDSGCQVRYDADLRLHGPLRLADPGLRAAFQVIGGRAEAGLRETLTGPVRSPA